MLDRPPELAAGAPFERQARSWSADAGGNAAADLVPNFRALLGILRRRRLPLALSIVLTPLLAWIALGQITPRYTATAMVLYEPNAFSARELQSILRIDPTTDTVMGSQAEIIRGQRVAERVAERLGLGARSEFNRELRPPVAPMRWLMDGRRALDAAMARLSPALAARIAGHGAPGAAAGDARGAVGMAVRDAIGVSVAKGSRVLEVSFTSQDRRLSADAVNLVAGFYIGDQLQAKFDAVRHATRWLETRVGELRREVRAGEDGIAAYRASQGLVKGVQAGLGTEQVSRLSADLMQARNDLAKAQARLDAARGASGGQSGAAAQAAIGLSVVPLRAQQEQLSAQLQSMLARLGPNHPEVVAQRRQLAEATRAVGGEIARVVVAAQADLGVERERVAALEQALRDAQGRLEASEKAQIPLNALERDAEASRTLLQAVLERIQQTVQQSAIETADARIISAGLAPAWPSFPRTTPLLAAAAAFGVLFGLLLVYLLELSDSGFRSGEDVRQVLGLPCFALIPEITARLRGRGTLMDYAAHRPLSPFCEQLRALRAGLWLGAERPCVVAVTAARPAEGKTTTALALGRVAAMAGERVAVIDCDIRQPGLGKLLGADGNLGLVDCLLGHAERDTVMRRDSLTELDYIPAGAAETNSLGLLMSDAMVTLLDSLRRDYDLVLLDAPPALAMADARVVARLADATLLCLRWRSTPRDVVRNSLDLLQQAQVRLAGVVLTRVDPRAHARSGFADAEIYHPRYGGYFRE